MPIYDMKYLIALMHLVLIPPTVLFALQGYAQEESDAIRNYFVDSVAGDDTHSGLSKDAA